MPAQPIFRRFWIKVKPDGSALPQFDTTGKDHGCGEYEGPVAQILFYPVSPKLAGLIQSHGDKAEPSRLRPLAFDIPPGEEVTFHRVGVLRIEPIKVCGFCGAEFDFELRECPRCLARLEWHCDKCDSLKEPLIDTLLVNSQKRFKKIKIVPALQKWAWKIAENLPGRWSFYDIQARCPDCEIAGDPRGLRLVRCVGDSGFERLFTHYILQFGNERHIILDYKTRS